MGFVCGTVLSEVVRRLSRRAAHHENTPMLKPAVLVLFCGLFVVGCAGMSEEVSSAESVQQTGVVSTPTPEAPVSDATAPDSVRAP